MIEPSQLLGVLDHTFLKTEREGVDRKAQQDAVSKWILEAHEAGAYAVCFRSEWASFAREQLLRFNSHCKLAVTIGFPDGDANTTAEKCEELRRAREQGAAEFDMVLRVQALHARDLNCVYQDVLTVSREAGPLPLKVILETDLLTPAEKKLAVAICVTAFSDAQPKTGESWNRFLKTSTGFVPSNRKPQGATLEDLKEMATLAGPGIGLKASGGVTTCEKALLFAHAFPDRALSPNLFRIGSSSLLHLLKRPA